MGHWEKKDQAGGAMPVEIKGQFDALQKLLTGIRDEQQRVDAELKKKGSADVLVVEKVDRMDKGFDQLKSDVDALFKRLARPQLAAGDQAAAGSEAKAIEWMRGRINPQAPASVEEAKAADALREYKAAANRYVRAGKDALTYEEQKALQVGSAPDGGYWVEPARSDQIVTRLRETSNMRRIASAVTVTTSSIKFPVDRDDVGYGWVGETSSRTETTTPQVGELEIPVHEIYAEPRASQNMLDDAGFDVEGWLNDKVLDRFGRAENSAFVNGSGTNAPRGFLAGTPVTTVDATRAFGVLQYIFTGASGAFATASATVSPADTLLDLIYAFKAGYRQNLTWAGTRVTLGAIRKFKDQQGNFIYDPRIGANGIMDMVLGYRWEEFADMADYTTANAFAIALGDFRRGYQIVDRQGVRQLRDPLTSRPWVKFYTTKRTGGAVVDSDAIKLLKFGTS